MKFDFTTAPRIPNLEKSFAIARSSKNTSSRECSFVAISHMLNFFNVQFGVVQWQSV